MFEATTFFIKYCFVIVWACVYCYLLVLGVVAVFVLFFFFRLLLLYFHLLIVQITHCFSLRGYISPSVYLCREDMVDTQSCFPDMDCKHIFISITWGSGQLVLLCKIARKVFFGAVNTKQQRHCIYGKIIGHFLYFCKILYFWLKKRKKTNTTIISKDCKLHILNICTWI